MALKDLFAVPRGVNNAIETPVILIENERLKNEVMPVYQEQFGKNKNFNFRDSKGRGSNVFNVGGLNYILQDSNFRMPVPTDNIHETIFPVLLT